MPDDRKKVGRFFGVAALFTGLSLIYFGTKKTKPTPPEEEAEFAYASDLMIEVTHHPTPHDIRWTVDVTNTGENPADLHLKIYDRMSAYGRWASFGQKANITETVLPGETKTFSGIVKRYPYRYQLMAKSEAGILLNPESPLLYVCDCCGKEGELVSFATWEEFEAHAIASHTDEERDPTKACYRSKVPDP